MIEPRYRRASATAEEIEERRKEARRQGYVSTPLSKVRPSRDRDDRHVGVIGKSAIRHRPLDAEFVIPLSDGTQMHVTERELSDMPQEYRQAAVLVAPQPVKRQALPKPQLQEPQTDGIPKQRRRSLPRFHWLVYVGLAMFLMLIGWVLLTYLSSWWQTTQDDWHYGRPRTYQTDMNVGHGTSQNPMSHFIAINLNKHIEVIEMPGDDPANSLIYIGPTLIGPGQELTPVTLSFEDVNHDGHPDLVIHVADSKFIFFNQQVKGVWKFVPAPNQ